MRPARGVVSLALIGLAVTPTQAADPAPLDAEMLRDLDVVGSPTYTRDRELARRLRLVERMRMLDDLRKVEAEAPPPPVNPTTTPAAPAAPKEVK
jgi:hypothetical protein